MRRAFRGPGRTTSSRSEAEAYSTQADILRILYLRRWRQQPGARTPRIRFNDLPRAVDYLERALTYERQNPIGCFPPAQV
ncbi:MAG: hypothetical protein R3F55_09965 [Alphaproteobacteria bacterium]